MKFRKEDESELGRMPAGRITVLGEVNEYVLKDLLDLNEENIECLHRNEIIV